MRALRSTAGAAEARGGEPASDPLDGVMRRYGAGDDDAFDDLYAQLSPRLYPFCLRLAGRKAEADDVFQEAFLRLHRARASYVPGSSVVPWAFAIARSVYLDRIRRLKRRPVELAGEDAEVDSAASALSGGAGSPEASAHARELARIVHRELARMSELNRTAYVLLRYEGLSVSEAAAIVGASADALKQRAHRADEAIREAVSRAGW